MTYMGNIEYTLRVERRQQMEFRYDGDRLKRGYDHEKSKAEQCLAGEQVMRSTEQYSKANLENNLTRDQLDSIKVRNLSRKGVRTKDIARGQAQYEHLQDKATRRHDSE